MSETAKIRDIVEPYLQGFGIDVGCGNDKVTPRTIGLDCRQLPCVTIQRQFDDLKLFGSKQFEYVYSSHFLEHIENPKGMLKEMKRVLKKDGFLILYLPDPNLYKEDNPKHIEMWTPKGFKKIIAPLKLKTKLFKEAVDYSYLYVGQK